MTSIVVTATTFTLFKVNTQETTKEVPRPEAAAPLLRWRPTAAPFVAAKNRVDVVALNTIFVLRLSKTGRTVGQTDSRLDGWSVGRTVGVFMTALRAALYSNGPERWFWALKTCFLKAMSFGNILKRLVVKSPI